VLVGADGQIFRVWHIDSYMNIDLTSATLRMIICMRPLSAGTVVVGRACIVSVGIRLVWSICVKSIWSPYKGRQTSNRWQHKWRQTRAVSDIDWRWVAVFYAVYHVECLCDILPLICLIKEALLASDVFLCIANVVVPEQYSYRYQSMTITTEIKLK